MAEVLCPRCSKLSDTKKGAVSAMGALATGSAAGAFFGSSIGIVGGPLGGIAGTIPGALIGAGLAYLGCSKYVKCRHCGKIFLL